jgi:septum formation protein
MHLVLASGSARRALLLSMAGYTFDVSIPDVDEAQLPGEEPAAYVLRLSEEKAATAEAGTESVVIGADTAVVLDGVVLGKPNDEEHALEMLVALSGRSHHVLTGWTVIRGQESRFGVAESIVTFTRRTPEELRGYIRDTDPLDKAGAYAIQGDDGWLIDSVRGSRSNVMGLPVADVVDALSDLGIPRSAPDRH